MKTISRLIRRYILAAFAIVLLVLTVNGVLLASIVIRYGSQSMQEGFSPWGNLRSLLPEQRMAMPRIRVLHGSPILHG